MLLDFYFRKLTLEVVWRMVWRSTKIPQNCNVTLGNDNGLNQRNGSWDDNKTTKKNCLKKKIFQRQIQKLTTDYLKGKEILQSAIKNRSILQDNFVHLTERKIQILVLKQLSFNIKIHSLN